MTTAKRTTSIIIPCHNAEHYLAQTLGSVLDQTVPVDDIIVVDDGSTDDSLAIAQRFEAAHGDRLRVYSQRSGNAPITRNTGASLATGEALMFLDADDVLAPNAIEALSEALAEKPSGIAACAWRRLDKIDGTWLSQPATCAPRRPDQDALAAWLMGWYYPPCSVLWSREAFLHIGGWDESAPINQDGDLMMRALASGIALAETDRGTAYYRRMPQGETSLSGRKGTYEGLLGRIAVTRKIAELLEVQGQIDRYRKPISWAFGRIAADAAGRYNYLSYQAQQWRRHYRPSVWSRGMARFMRSEQGPGKRPEPQAPRNQVEEITYGSERADQVLAATADHLGNKPKAPTERPAVSVVIPVHNRAHLLEHTLTCVLQQTFHDFEVLVVDDCSTDDPRSVVEALQDSRLRYLRQPENKGVAAARNRGLREAKAPLVAFLDDDDEWLPEKLAQQVALFERSPKDVGFIYTGVETITEDGRLIAERPTARGDLYRELLVQNILHGASSSGMIRRSVITTVGFFDETLPAIEDYEYWLRICRHFKTDCVSQPLVRYNDFRGRSGAAETEKRRSLNIKANLDARAQLYRKHGAQMRHEGLAHLYLMDSAQRHAAKDWQDWKGARRLALQALWLSPTLWLARKVLTEFFVPNEARNLLNRGRRAFTRNAGVGHGK